MNVNFASVVIPSLPYLILLAAWIVAVVFAIRIFRRKNERAELLLLTGVCLLLAGSLISFATTLLSPWIMVRISHGGPLIQMRYLQIVSAINIFRACLSLGGIVLLVIAFWKKFRPEKEKTVSLQDRGDLEL